MKREGLEIFS